MINVFFFNWNLKYWQNCNKIITILYRIILENTRYRISIEFQLQRKFELLQYSWFMKKKEQLLQISTLSMYVYILCSYISFISLLKILKILIKINIDLLALFNIMYHLCIIWFIHTVSSLSKYTLHLRNIH